MSRRVVICDYLYGVQPFELQELEGRGIKVSLESLLQELVKRDAELRKPYSSVRRPELKEVEDDFRPPWCTYVYAEREDGRAFLWKSQVDSSG